MCIKLIIGKVFLAQQQHRRRFKFVIGTTMEEKEKRSGTLTFLGYFLLIGGILGILLFFRVAGIFNIQFILSIICGIGIIKRLHWARLATIYVEVAIILCYCFWCSPVFQKERIAQAEAKYRHAEKEEGEKFSISLKGPLVSKSEYLAYEQEKVEKEKMSQFLWGTMLIKSIIPLLIISLLSKRKIKEEFEIKPVSNWAE